MTGKSTSFEIQVLQDSRWILADVAGEEAKAVAFADNLLTKGNHSAVRVVRDFHRLDGRHSETVIHEKTADPIKADLAVVAVSDSPVCAGLDDFYELPSRLVIGRVFRRYLNELTLTPTELLHSAREMKRLGDKGQLLFSAIDNIATVQARVSGEDGKARRDFLSRSWEAAVARARKAEPSKPPPAKAHLAELMRAAGGDAAERDFRCRALMTPLLMETRDWGGKLDTALAWAAEAEDVPQMALVDGVVADLMMSAQLIQDLLGFQANLGAALSRMCDLAEGKTEPAEGAPAAFAEIDRLLGRRLLPQTRAVLLSRIARELRGTNPLSQNEPGREFEMFVQVTERLITYQGVVGGGASAEAVAQRHMRLQNIGGAAGLLQAVDGVARLLGDGCRQTQYIVALAESPAVATLGDAAADALIRLGRSATTMDAWAPKRLAPRDRMAALAACNKAITATTALPVEVRTDIAGLTDAVMVRYLEDENIIEKIDKPDDSLALRAIRLVKFCGSGVLIPGQSLERARRRVIGHLRQPQFEERFLASIPDPAQAERHLREFHRLLVESGFR
jgi:hypothetical protein